MKGKRLSIEGTFRLNGDARSDVVFPFSGYEIEEKGQKTNLWRIEDSKRNEEKKKVDEEKEWRGAELILLSKKWRRDSEGKGRMGWPLLNEDSNQYDDYSWNRKKNEIDTTQNRLS